MNNKPIKPVTSRSMVVAVLLAVVFGTFGLFYASIAGALILFLGAPLAAGVVLAMLQGPTDQGSILGMLLVAWVCVRVAAIVWAVVATLRRNAAAERYVQALNRVGGAAAST